MLTAETLRDLLHYDPETGEFRWRNCSRPHLNGRIAGTLNTAGYRVIRVSGELHYGHRLARLYQTGAWPVVEVDHRDLDKSNNRWGNLRDATHEENSTNEGLRNSNSSGHKGVYFNKRQQQWHASITVSGRSIHLGYFDDIEIAAAIYAKASNDLHGEFGRTASV